MSALFEVATRVQHRDVLDGGGDHVAPGDQLSDTLQGEVVGFGGTGRENDSGRSRPDQTGDLGSGSIERFARFETQRVWSRSVPGPPFQKGPHDGGNTRI